MLLMQQRDPRTRFLFVIANLALVAGLLLWTSPVAPAALRLRGLMA